MVSYWQAPSAGAVKLLTGIFTELAKAPGIARAEAIRRSMVDMLDASGPPELAHPASWGGFVLAGEGQSEPR
jgi:CHAT domain-containing protein